MTQKAPRELRQQQIMEAAISLFTTRGYEGTTMEDIASVAGLSKGAVYHHYATKQDVLLDTGEHLVRPLYLFLDDALLNPDPVAGLLEFAAALLSHWRERPLEYAYTLHFFSQSFANRESWANFNRHFTYQTGILTGIFDRAIASGALASFDTEPAAIAFMSFLNGYTGYHVIEFMPLEKALLIIRKTFIDPYLPKTSGGRS